MSILNNNLKRKLRKTCRKWDHRCSNRMHFLFRASVTFRAESVMCLQQQRRHELALEDKLAYCVSGGNAETMHFESDEHAWCEDDRTLTWSSWKASSIGFDTSPLNHSGCIGQNQTGDSLSAIIRWRNFEIFVKEVFLRKTLCSRLELSLLPKLSHSKEENDEVPSFINYHCQVVEQNLGHKEL